MTTPKNTGSDPADVPGVATRPRWSDRRKAAPLAKIGMICFCIGTLAIVADVILFASGFHDLPLWLNLTALLAPIGLGVGLVGILVENRKAAADAHTTAEPA